MRRDPFVTSPARTLALLAWLFSLTGGALLLAPGASAQTCGVQGPGFQGGSIQPIVRLQRGTEPFEEVPRNPIPTGEGYNLFIDAIAQVSGFCEDLDPSGSGCVVDGTWYNDFSRIRGLYTRPGESLSNPNSLYEYAINPNGTTAHVQYLDSRDDTTSGGGPVVVLPSGGVPTSGFTTGGTYTTRMTVSVSQTPCDPQPIPLLDSGLLTFDVTNTDNAKDICEASGPADVADSQGNPCSARSRSKWEREVDSEGPVLPFVRRYSSISMFDIGLGWGWSSNYHGKMLTPLATRLNVVRPGGHAQVFIKQADGSWLGDADTRWAITQDANGFVLTHRDGTRETYGTDGRLLSESDPSGNTTALTYDAAGRLITVTGPYGHQLSFAYDATGHLQTVTPPSGEAITYTYSNDDLVSVTYPDTRTRLYHYENAAQPHKLTGITDEKGIRYATFSYDSSGRIFSTEHATTTNGAPQERFTFPYYSNNITKVTDPRGYTEEFHFSENLKYRRLTTHKHVPDNKSVTQTFDARNNVLTRTDELGRITTFAWNATNQMTSRTEASGTELARTTAFTYNSPTLHLPTTITRPSVYGGQSAITQITYHPVHLRPTQVTESGFRPDGTAVSRTTSFQYNTRGQITQIDGPRTDVSDITTFGYHECTTGTSCGQLQSVTNALGQTTSFGPYDADGRILESTDPLGTVTATTYDDRGRVLTMTRTPTTSLPRTWSFTSDPAGKIATSTSPAGVVLTYTHDEAHDLRSIQDSAGNRIEYLYDLAGNRTSEKLKDDSGTLQHEIQAAYDTRSRLSQLTEAGSITQILFNAVGNLTSQTDPNNHATTFSFDALDRLTSAIDALTGNTQYQYRVNDSLSQLTAPNAVATGYATDDLGRQISETSPDRGSLAYAHDAAGNVATFTHLGSGRTEGFSYDALNRPLTRNYAGTTEDVAFGYDSCPNGTGRLCSITHEAGSTSFEYDAFGNPTRKLETILGVPYQTLYVWDKDDRLTQITYPTGHVVAYARNTQGRIQAVTLDGANVVTNRSFRGDGRLLSQTWGNGLAETRTYNGLGLLATYTLGSVENEAYTYDPAGNLTARSGSSWSLGYGYDALDRLTTDNGGSGSRSYQYDGNGNRLSKTVSGSPTSYTYQSGSNRLATIAGSSVTLDVEGRTTVVPSYIYGYNASGRLQTTSQNSTEVGRYAYDASGLRRTKIAGGQTSVYHLDESGHLLAETNAGGVTQRIYVWADAAPIAQKVGSALTYLHTDHLDTLRWGTSSAAALVWRWRSDGFGEALPEEDVDGNAVTVSVNLRFPGQYYDAESGLHYNWMRDYNPGYGRYIESDPIGLPGGINTYLFADAEPTRLTDPTGEQAAEAVASWVAGDVLIPDPSDAAWPKWVGYGVGIGAAGVIDWMILESIDATPDSVDESTDEPDQCDADDECGTKLVICLENKFSVPPNHPFGRPLDCGSCYSECVAANGRWPYYKCPL